MTLASPHPYELDLAELPPALSRPLAEAGRHSFVRGFSPRSKTSPPPWTEGLGKVKRKGRRPQVYAAMIQV